MTREQISARLDLIKRHVRRIRTFGCADGLEFAPTLARSAGLKVAAGAWISANVNENERQLANLIEIGRAGDADLLVVGSETLLRGELSGAALMVYIDRVKTALPALRVSYADTWSTLLDHPALIAAVDVVMVNYYPFWEGVAIENALLAISDWHARIRIAAGAKPVAVSEAGRPSAGNTVGNAVPSEENESSSQDASDRRIAFVGLFVGTWDFLSIPIGKLAEWTSAASDFREFLRSPSGRRFQRRNDCWSSFAFH